MPTPVRRLWFVLSFGVLATAGIAWSNAAPDRRSNGGPARNGESTAKTVNFSEDVFPLLKKHCFECHGPDSQEGQLRVDAKAIVFKGGKTGPGVVPGKPDRSLLLQRILGKSKGKRMPLDADPLTAKEIAVVRQWIQQGAHWPKGVGSPATSVGRHWAYVKPKRPKLPAVRKAEWLRNPIDAFVLARLETEGLSPSPEADRARLLRRVTLDLTGLPPTTDELDAFLTDRSPNAYEKAVDRLLASPRYGERWATPWLDAARYADSNGYQRDGRRVYWAYRDWVVDALNADMPFDRFTIEQIAGDLLPGTTVSQRIATGFHRGTMANVEAGTDPDEEHVLAIIDRVNTTGTVWLGTTIECGQCHDHKYDPFSQTDYYRLYAFFNNTEKEIRSVGSRRDFIGPKMELGLTPAQRKQREQLQRQTAALDRRIAAVSKSLRDRQAAWEREVATKSAESSWTVLAPVEFESLEGSALKKLADQSLLAVGNRPATDVYRVTANTDLKGITAFRAVVLTDDSLPGKGPGRAKPGNFILSEFQVEIAPADAPSKFRRVKLKSAFADYSQPRWPVKNAIDGNRKTGWAVAKKFGRPHWAVFTLDKPAGYANGCVLRFTLDQQYGGSRTIGRFQLLATTGDPRRVGIPPRIRRIASLPAGKRNKKQRRQLAAFFQSRSHPFRQLQAKKKALQAALGKVRPITTLVMKERDKPRETRVFKRGDFLKPVGKPLRPGTPKALHAMPADNNPNRLTLAKWLVDGNNPLTARVTVNRHWAEFFGRGLVSTLEDFGTQGERPTHPALLDWLAVEFQKSWSVKRLHRLIVTSATYRQSARVSPELLRRDRFNTLYARGPRGRLKAEFVRDNALAVAGLLSQKMHGPPVFPYQPAGVWNHIGVASNNWATSSPGNLHRRGLYTYWRRTVPYPSFVNFDAPSREACTVKRSQSNTPLQALTLMNDLSYFEAAVRFAGRVLSEPPWTARVEDRVRWAFRLATSREPNSAEVAILTRRYREELERYSKAPAAAKKLLATWKLPAGVKPASVAAWTHVTNVLLNLDETISR
ncbi:MAG: PSD1 and planctomycete cytochrome C domain-containing protein [Planctomycetaceae bacterium]